MRTRFLALWTVAVLASATAFVVHLAMRFETIRLGYEVGKERREQARLIEDRRQLAIEAATLRQAARLETVARGALEMETPGPDQVVHLDQPKRRRRTAGRVR